MFNLTKEIKLSEKWNKRYKVARSLLFLIFFVVIMWVAHTIIFPSKNFFFSFLNSNSSRNSIKNLEIKEIPNGKEIIFDATSIDDFSKIKTEVVFARAQNKTGGSGKVSVKKSYRSFFYPEGEEIFGNFEAEGLNPQDGKLVSDAQAVYLLNKGKKFPFDNPITFESLGFSWKDVTPIDSEEIQKYEKENLLNINDAHPDGVVLKEEESGDLFYIKNGEKRKITGENLKELYSKNGVILAGKESNKEQSCILENNASFPNIQYCQIEIESISQNIGKDYNFHLSGENFSDIEEIRVTFKKSISVKNLKSSLAKLFGKISGRYSSL